MSLQQSPRKVREPVDLDIPKAREYKTEADADLDRKLIESIEAAEAAGNDSLAQLLRFELGSHYYQSHA